MNANDIIKKLTKCGFEVFIVGGAVRDLLREVKAKDIDIATSATSEQIIEVFAGEKIKVVGKNFNVVLINNIEIATFRADEYNGLNDKDVKISNVKTINEDLARRDFSINSMALCMKTGQIIDDFNGKEDLKNKIIRFTGDPEKRIYEDPNRILRACRFLASINGTFAKETKDALIKYSYLVKDHIRKERIQLEIIKAIKIQKASIFWRSLHDIGALQYIFPSLDKCFGLDHGEYHEEDVGTHCMLCGNYITTRYPILKLAGYLHDIGKINYIINSESRKVSFIDHDKTGADLAYKELKVLRFSNDNIEYISNLISLHMRNHRSLKSIRKTLRKIEGITVSLQDLLRLKLADRKANLKRERCLLSHVIGVIKNIEREKERKPPKKFGDLNINGTEIMLLTNLKPGPKIGKILNFLLDQTIDDPDLNKKDILETLTLEYLKWRG